MEDGFIEYFNGRLRVEGLNVEVFFTLKDVRAKLAHWQQDYNLVRAPASYCRRVGRGNQNLACPSGLYQVIVYGVCRHVAVL